MKKDEQIHKLMPARQWLQQLAAPQGQKQGNPALSHIGHGNMPPSDKPSLNALEREKEVIVFALEQLKWYRDNFYYSTKEINVIIERVKKW